MAYWEYAIPGWNAYAAGRDIYGAASGKKMPGMGDTFSAMADWWNKKNAPQIPQNPYLGEWGGLINQLKQTASGQGPSLAGNAYNQAHGQALADQMSMASGGSAGAQRQAGMNMARTNQGLAAGYSNARLQEQLAAQQALQGTLTGAGNAWFQPQAANLQAQLGTQSNGQQLLQFLTQGAMAGAKIFGGKGGQ